MLTLSLTHSLTHSHSPTYSLTQSELDDNLNNLNNDINTYIQVANIPLPNDNDLARDNILKVVEELEGKLELMEGNIEKIG